jgi:hypothetical protein
LVWTWSRIHVSRFHICESFHCLIELPSGSSFLGSHMQQSNFSRRTLGQRCQSWSGRGGSTIFFANRTASVFCIESNVSWAQAINSKLSELGIRTVSVEVHDFDLGDAAGFAQSPFVRAIKSRRPDVIAIDGYEESVPLRPICFSVAEELIAPGGMIIVDDSWRYPMIRKSSNAKHWREFRSVGPCRYGVTTTDIHFY